MATALITRTTDTNDSGGGTDGTIRDNAWLQAIYDQIDAYVQSTQRFRADGRITLTAATPVTTADVTAATTIRYALYAGNEIAIYDTVSSTWKFYTFAELTLSLGADAANTNYDLFAIQSGGTVALERLAWTNDTTRATALTLQDGVFVKTGDAARRYLGTYRTTGTVGQTEDSYAKRYVWNYYNRSRRPMRVNEATDSWTYSVATYRQANGSAANQLDFVIGVNEVPVEAIVLAYASNSTANTPVRLGIGFDSTTTISSDCNPNVLIATTAGANGFTSHYRAFPGVGRHTLVWLEWSTATLTTTWYGDAGIPPQVQSGISGFIDG